MVNNQEIDLLPDQPLGEKLLKKWFWLYFFAYLAAPAGYLIRVMISKSVSVEEVGILYSIISFITLISVYNDLWLTESLQYFLPRFWIKKKFDFVKTSIFLSLWVQICTALLIIIWLWFGSDWLALNYFHNPSSAQILKYFIIYFLWINLFQILQSIFISFQDTFSYKFVEFVKQWSIALFVWLFLFIWEPSIINYSIAWIWWFLLALFLWIFFFKKKYWQTIKKGKLVYDKNMIKEYRKYALWVFLWANAANLLTQIDQQMIIIILWPKMAWFYANYLSLLAIGSILIWPIVWIIFPLVSEFYTKKDTKKLQDFQRLLFTYFSIFAVSLSWIFISLHKELALLFYGEKFLFSWNLLWFVSPFLVLWILVGLCFSFLNGLWKVREKVKIILFVGILNIIMNLIFMKYWGVYGVIVSTIVGWFIMVSFSLYMINQIQKIKMQRSIIIKNLIIVSLLTIIIIYTKLYIWNIINTISLYVIWMILLYYLLLWLANWKQILLLKKEFKNLKNK